MSKDEMQTLADRLVTEGRLTRGHADELLAGGHGAYLQMISMGLLYDKDSTVGKERARRDDALVDEITDAVGGKDTTS